MRFLRLGIILALCGAAVCALGQSGHELEFERTRMLLMLNTVSDEIHNQFYDPKLNGVDWKLVTEQARERVKAAKSVGEMLTAIFSMVDKLQDSHTKFIPPRMAVRIRFGFKAKPFGEEIRVYEVKKASAAARAGLEVGDRITRVNGFSAQRETWRKMMTYFRVLRPVNVMDMIIQRGQEAPRPLKIEADMQKQAAVLDFTKSSFDYYRLVDEAEEDRELSQYAHYEGDLAYVKINSFSADEHVFRVAGKEVEHARAAIVDLRENGGGAVDNLRYFAGFFEPEPATLAEEVWRKKTEQIKIKNQAAQFKGKMYVLVDSNSASASEMFARYFQRRGRAVIVGDHTPGLVNASMYFSETFGNDRIVAYGVQVAVARVRFPDGEELEKKGVTPDVVCVPGGEDLKQQRDPCLLKAVNLARAELGLPEVAELRVATTSK